MRKRIARTARYWDRALRPTAAAVRVLAVEAAATNDLIRGLVDELRADRLAAAAPAAPAGAAAAPTDPAPVAAVAERTGPPDNAEYDAWTAQVIARVLTNDPGSAIDVGAHHGDILRSMVDAAPDRHHYAFEPLPAMAGDLRERFPAVTVHQVALAAETGSTTFRHVVSNPGYSGLRERRYDRPDEEIDVIDVELRRLDDMVAADDQVSLIKIDVEGAELGVLQGASRTLSTWHPVVVFECGLGASDFYGTTPAMIHEAFAEHDMSVTLLDRWLRGEPPLTLDEFDREYSTGRSYYFLAYRP